MYNHSFALLEWEPSVYLQMIATFNKCTSSAWNQTSDKSELLAECDIVRSLQRSVEPTLLTMGLLFSVTQQKKYYYVVTSTMELVSVSAGQFLHCRGIPKWQQLPGASKLHQPTLQIPSRMTWKVDRTEQMVTHRKWWGLAMVGWSKMSGF